MRSGLTPHDALGPAGVAGCLGILLVVILPL